MREEPNASWLRNGVATWSGSVYLYDSRRARTAPRPEEPEQSTTDPPPQIDWSVSSYQTPTPRATYPGIEGSDWAIEFGTGRRVRTRRGR
jgi:hypothetical protein